MSRYSRASKSKKSATQSPALQPQAVAKAEQSLPCANTSAMQRPSRWRHGAIAIVLMGLCAALYAWTADFPLAFDDNVYLEHNPVFKDARSFGYWSEFRDFATKPAKQGLDPDLAINFILRPVAYATFHLNYLFDGFTPRWYRLVNILIHAGNALLIYALLTQLLNRNSRGIELSRKSVAFIATTTALLFAAHPLATESVTYIVQRFTSLAAFFFLLTLLLHFLANSMRSGSMQWLLRAASVAVLVLGMQTKEETVTAPLIVVLLDTVVVGTAFKTALRRALPLLLCLPIIPGLVLLTTWAQHDGVLRLSDGFNIVNIGETSLPHWHYAVTQLTVVVGYLRLLFWPAGLNLDPHWPLYRSLSDAPVLGALAVILTLLVGSWLLYRRLRTDVRFAAVFAFITWYFATIIVSSGLVPLPDLMAEHRSYLPSIGIFAAVACLLDRCRTSLLAVRSVRWLAPACVVACTLALSVTTWQRNQVWHTTVSLWEDTVAKSPGKPRVWSNLGYAYGTAGRMEEAVPCLRKAVELNPQFYNGWTNLFTALKTLNRCQELLDACSEVTRHFKQGGASVEVHYHRGVALCGLGRQEEGFAVLNNLLQSMPTHQPTHIILGSFYSQIHQPQKSLYHYEQALALEPSNTVMAQIVERARQTTSLAGQ